MFRKLLSCILSQEDIDKLSVKDSSCSMQKFVCDRGFLTCSTQCESRSKYLGGWLYLSDVDGSEGMVDNFCWRDIPCIYSLFKQQNYVAKNVCTPSFLGSLDVAKALNEHPKFYKVLSILLILWGILEGSVKHSHYCRSTFNYPQFQ